MTRRIAIAQIAMHALAFRLQDAPAIAALWHAGGLESGARDPGFLPRMPVDDLHRGYLDVKATE